MPEDRVARLGAHLASVRGTRATVRTCAYVVALLDNRDAIDRGLIVEVRGRTVDTAAPTSIRVSAGEVHEAITDG